MFSLDASTQHNDMRGTIALDWPNVGGGDIHSFASTVGIDTDKYFPVALKFFIGKHNTFLRVYAVEESDETRKYDNLIKYAQSRNGKLPVVEFSKEYSFNDFLKRPEVLSMFLNALHRYLGPEDLEVVEEVPL